MSRWFAGRQMILVVPLAILGITLLPPLFIPGLSIHHWIHSLTAALVLLAAPGAFAFPLMYAKAPWWTTRLGRAVMMMAIGNSGIIIIGLLRVIEDWPTISNTYTGDPLSVDLARLALYWWLFVAIYYKTYALYAVTQEGSDLHTDDAEVRSHSH